MISELRLQNFRSYFDKSFELSDGVNIIVGPNASGKTNLLEAVLVVARGASYRVRDTDLISFDKPWARLDARTNTGGSRTVKIVTEPRSGKSYEIDGKSYQRLTLAHSLPIVLFEPNHLQLLSGGPENRRDYMDDLLEQTTPGYGVVRRQYRRTLSQRNRLLKNSNPPSQTTIFPWNIRLSQLAGQIVRARYDLIERINEDITELYTQLSQTETHVTVEYTNKWSPQSYETQLIKKLETSLDDDRLRGFTSSGPHREDLSVIFDNHPASEVASRGETRTAILALKIIELQIIKAARETTPLLLLDDVFSELDSRRRHALTDYLAPYQTFITTTDADLATEAFSSKANVIQLN